MKFTLGALLFVSIFSVLCNLPRLWSSYHRTMNCVGGHTVHYLISGPMSKQENPTLFNAFLWIYFILSVCVPVIILSYCNVKLICALRESARMRNHFRRSEHQTSGSHDGTHRISLTLIIIVVMYLLLVLPAESMGFLHDVLNVETTTVFNLVAAAFNVCQALNFAMNFVLYCVINVHFRKTLVRICLCSYFSRRLPVNSTGSHTDSYEMTRCTAV